MPRLWGRARTQLAGSLRACVPDIWKAIPNQQTSRKKMESGWDTPFPPSHYLSSRLALAKLSTQPANMPISKTVTLHPHSLTAKEHAVFLLPRKKSLHFFLFPAFLDVFNLKPERLKRDPESFTILTRTRRDTQPNTNDPRFLEAGCLACSPDTFEMEDHVTRLFC